MGNPIYRLVYIGFDSLENHSPRYEKTVGLFMDQPSSSALDRIESVKCTYPIFKGYDDQIYPQWLVIEDPIL